MKNLVFLLFALGVLIPLYSYAHPGNTAADGCHYCRTNCGSWGVQWNERHCHGGSTRSYSSATNYYTTPAQPTCPLNSRSNFSGGCECNSGYVASGGKCISYSSYCTEKYGLMSTYSYLNDSCQCIRGYELRLSGKCEYKSRYSGYTSNPTYSSLKEEKYNCPKNSSQSKTDADKCTCNIGYKTNKAKDGCTKISKSTNDKQCRASFGSKSQWNGKYSDEGTPYCGCKKGYDWNDAETACVK